MIRVLSSLTNRIFLATAALAVVSIGVSVWVVNVMVTAQAERELRRGLEEAGLLVQEYRALSLGQLTQQARLIADLPKFKAAVELGHPPTLQPLAADYRRQIESEVFVVVSRDGRLLAGEGLAGLATGTPVPPPWQPGSTGNEERHFFLSEAHRLVQVVTVPIWLDTDVLGALSVGIALDEAFASRVKRLTDSDIAFVSRGRVHASTLAAPLRPALEQALQGGGDRIALGGQDYVWLNSLLPASARTDPAAPGAIDDGSGARVVVMRSRTERLRFLGSLHTALAFTAFVAVLASILISYAVALTITRPLATITNAMRETASTGDLTRRLSLPSRGGWEDEDARLLANTFNAMTASIAEFQREATQRERLAALGRLSTVLAHEVRNPLMIIKGALHGLRKAEATFDRVRAAAQDIDEEVARLNRLVNEVLDYARPIRFELAPADLLALCEEVVSAAEADGRALRCAVSVDAEARSIVTDVERLRLALVNLVSNARQAIPGDAAQAEAAEPQVGPADVELSARAGDGGVVELVVRDRGTGIAPEALPRVFEPYFTTRRTGTGIGLAITRNIVEGLGGTIRVSSEPGRGTEFRIQLPRQPRVSMA